MTSIGYKTEIICYLAFRVRRNIKGDLIMSEKCKEDCNTCGEECTDRKQKPKIVPDQPHELSKIKKVIGVVSGKGGVGKSLVTSMLAVTMNRRGYHCAVLDADITGPSIPKAFGINQKVVGNEFGMFPIPSSKGIDIMSINLLLPNVTDPVIWRGPLIGNMVKQFWTDVIWTDVDYMFIDMPPGTGDVALTVFQSIKVDGIVIVTSPQELVSMIVTKAVNMANMMNIPIIGIVENMSYFKCPDNDKNYYIFGESRLEEVAALHDLKILGQLPIDPKIALACDYGKIETYENEHFDHIADVIEGKSN